MNVLLRGQRDTKYVDSVGQGVIIKLFILDLNFTNIIMNL